MPYRVLFTPAAERDLGALPPDVRVRVEARISGLGVNPRPPGCKKLSGRGNLWRIRAGDYRILYEIHDRALFVLVVKIGHRGDVYE